MPYDVPAGMLALGGLFGQGAAPIAQNFANARQARQQGQDRELEGLLGIARMQGEINAQRAEQAKLQAFQQQQAAQQRYASGLSPDQRGLFEAAPDQFAAQAAQAAFATPEQADPRKGFVEIDGQLVDVRDPNNPRLAYDAPDKPEKPILQEAGGIIYQLVNGKMVPMTQKAPERSQPPVGYREAPAGAGLEAIPGGPADPTNPKNITGEQRTSAGFAQRLQTSQGKLSALEQSGYNPASLAETARGTTRITSSNEYLTYQNEKDEWIRAILRKESGAAITQEERDSYGGYFPQVGDGPEQLAQKAEIRNRIMQGVVQEAGPAFKPKPKAVGEYSTEELLQMRGSAQ